MKPADPTSSPHSIPLAKLLSIVLLAGGMLLAATMTLKASWLWVLAPVALLLWLDVSSAAREYRFAALPFYGGLFATALAFHYVGLPAAPVQARNVATIHAGDTCGSRGCGTTGGCGTGGCGASSGGGCSCSSAARTAAAPVRTTAPPNAVRPTVAVPGNRGGGTGGQMPGQSAARPTGPFIQAPPRVSSANPGGMPAMPGRANVSPFTPPATVPPVSQGPPPAVTTPAAPSASQSAPVSAVPVIPVGSPATPAPAAAPLSTNPTTAPKPVTPPATEPK